MPLYELVLWVSLVVFSAIIALSALLLLWRQQQRRQSLALSKSAARYQTLMQTSIDGIHVMDEQGNIVEANNAFCRMLGYTQEEVARLNVADWDAQWSSDELRLIFRELIGKSNLIETVHRRKDGVLIEVEISSSGVELDGCSYIFASSRDITQRKRAEESLKNMATKYHTVFELSTDAIMLLNQKGFFDCNEATLRMFGCPARDDFISKHPAELSPPTQPGGEDSMSLANQRIATAIKNGSNRFEWMHRRLDGAEFSAEVLLTAMELDGKAVLQAVVRDISERKQVDDELRWRTAFFEALVNTSADGILVVDSKGRKILQNQRTGDLWKIPKEIMEDPDDGQQVQFIMNQTVDAKQFSDKVFYLYSHPEETSQDEVVLKDGIILDRYSAPVLDSGGHLYGRIWSFRDVTERKRAEQELRIAAAAFETQEGIIVTDAETRILRVNHAFTRLTGYSTEEAIGQTPAMLQSGRQDKDFYHDLWESLARDHYWQGEIWNRRKNGEIYPEWLTISAVINAEGKVTNYIGAFSDITQHKQDEADIHSLAFYDSLTGLPNRRLLHDRLQHTLVASARHHNHGALLFIDLDNFKTLNDTKGHNIGDLLLIEVANRLQACVREEDTASRLGGDEFVVILEKLSEKPSQAAAQTEAVGEKILASLSQPYSLKGHEYHSTSSIGISLFRHQEVTVDELLKRADTAMYQAKGAGCNTLRFYDPAMQEILAARTALESDLRRALAENQFRLYYQMQVDHTGHILGAEVLIRWQHPQRGLIPPLEFIPLAEETGLILPIGQWVLETACAQLKAWEADQLTYDLQLAVNVSARQFHQPDFVKQVRQTLRSHALKPNRLKLELTESLVLDNIDDTIVKMQALREVGVRFSMDDFGTGYSSLSYLTQLPLDQLKIDQSFVRNIGTKSTDAVIVQTIIGMANNLGMEIIAEGVETEEQRTFLEQHGCVLCQGYLFGRPVPVEEFEAKLKSS